ncbi:MAG: hypothetical protein D6706_16460 [Chloroflexi bacterium]|nr:MAG: hypothetical protein D6706_16460 [Chloroflexota bacterium]
MFKNYAIKIENHDIQDGGQYLVIMPNNGYLPKVKYLPDIGHLCPHTEREKNNNGLCSQCHQELLVVDAPGIPRAYMWHIVRRHDDIIWQICQMAAAGENCRDSWQWQAFIHYIQTERQRFV